VSFFSTKGRGILKIEMVTWASILDSFFPHDIHWVSHNFSVFSTVVLCGLKPVEQGIPEINSPWLLHLEANPTPK